MVFKNGAKVSAILILLLLLLGTISRALWMPWLSPTLAARFLILDDGKSLLNGSSSAARFWGSEVYAPLAQLTANFSQLNFYTSYTLLGIMRNDGTPPQSVVSELGSADNLYARILYCQSSIQQEYGVSNSACLKLAEAPELQTASLHALLWRKVKEKN